MKRPDKTKNMLETQVLLIPFMLKMLLGWLDCLILPDRSEHFIFPGKSSVTF